MTHIIGFIGSPRKTGNTAALVKAFMNGAADAGGDTSTVLLNTLNMRGCQACYLCKSSGVCAVKDDMTPLYEQIAQADIVVFGSPIYMGTVTAQCKLLLDRLYAFMKPDFSSRLTPGKTAVVLVAQGNPNEDQYASYLQTLKQMLGIAFTNVEEVVVAAGMRERGVVTQDANLMARIHALGHRLAAQYVEQ
jgi:multimeric flavodoxin WrbA